MYVYSYLFVTGEREREREEIIIEYSLYSILYLYTLYIIQYTINNKPMGRREEKALNPFSLSLNQSNYIFIYRLIHVRA